MTKAIISFIVIGFLLFPGDGYPQILDSIYHNLDEINEELFRLADEYSDLVLLDTIGYSQAFRNPILQVKISDNPARSEPEPALLFIGQVHAEEILGIEITLELMNLILENQNEQDFRERIEGLELYFIPTANPDGLEIVFGQDATFRKNCRDPIGDGRLRILAGPGRDTTGVDLNRNFGLHWDRGDSLFGRGENNFLYNYYRGESPFSESETQTLRDDALLHRYFMSISYHSSRSGQNSELVIAPWNWDAKTAPDVIAIDYICEELAAKIHRQGLENFFYNPVNSTQRNGQSNEWYYQATGTFQYMLEVGSEIQPDSAGYYNVIQANLPAAWYLMDVALGDSIPDSFGILSIIVTDSLTGLPLDAKIHIDAFNDRVLDTRRTSLTNGRFDWIMLEDEYSISIEKTGYRPQLFEDYAITGSTRSTLEIELAPLPLANCRFTVMDIESGNPIFARIMLDDWNNHVVYDFAVSDRDFEVRLSHDFFRIVILSEGYLPFISQLDIRENANLFYELYRSTVVYEETFDQDELWSRGGIGEDWGITSADGRNVLTESVSGDYPNGADIWLLLNTETILDTLHGAVLELIHRPYFEPGLDYGYIRASTVGDSRLIAQFSQFPVDWDTLYYDLDYMQPGPLRLRFQVTSDGSVPEDGWLIDRIRVYKTDGIRSLENQPITPGELHIGAFPNPFNSQTMIRFSLPQAGQYSLQVFDLAGRTVATLVDGFQASGEYNLMLQANRLNSGMYLVRLSSGNVSLAQKVILMK